MPLSKTKQSSSVFNDGPEQSLVAKRTVARAILFFLVTAALLPQFVQGESNAAAVRRPFVLTLHSYSPSDWDNGLQAGINQELAWPARIDLYVDYMDARKVVTPEYIDMVRQLLVVKYRGIQFDLVIVCDDAAYRFALQHRNQLWPGVPIVFCGVNDLHAQEFAGQENFTGISENNDLRAFVAAIPKVVPGLKTLIVVRDDSPYARDTLPYLLTAIHESIPGVEVQFIDNTLTSEELFSRMEKTPADSAVFFLSFWRDKNGRFVGGNEIQRILSHCTVPVFTSHLSHVGHGALGASYVDALDQGAAAGRIARDIINGRPASFIPAGIGPPRRLVFDHGSLQRFRVSRDALPAGSTIINQPYSFYRDHRTLVWTVLSTFATLSTLVILLVVVVLQRRRAVAGLMESEEKFSKAFRDSPVSMAIRDLETNRYIEVNNRLLALMGYTREEVLGRTLDEVGWKIDPDPTGLTGAAALADREAKFRRKDGRWVICSYTSHSVRIAGRECRLSITVDITERKQAEEALRANQHFIKSVLDTTPDIVYIYDVREQREVYSNHEILDILGYAKDDAIRMGKNWSERLIHPDDLARVAEHHRRVVANPSGCEELDYRMRDSRGKWRWLHNRDKVFARDEDGSVKQIVGTVSDVTERKRSDEEHEKLQAQLNQSQKMESVGRLAGGVAHDFNNMLTAIHMNATLARQAVPTDSPLKESLDEILLCTARSTELTQRLLAFARKQTVAPKVLDLNTTVEGMLKMLHRLIGEDIGLLWKPAADLWSIKVDPSQIDQVLANLCVNARDAISGVGKVTIVTKNETYDGAFCATHAGYLPGQYVLLSVSDDGCGMDKEVLGHLFEPFFTTKPVGQGTGLGLATVYGIVKQNRGFINVYSEPKHGTTFNVYFPRHADIAEQIRNEIPAQPVGRGHETILLVEDEPSILQIAKRALGMLGYTVLAAATPGEAIRLAEEHPGKIHLLMTDVVMPEMNGRDLAKRLLALDPAIKRLFMSGYTADVIAHQGVLEEGINFIQKPFSMQDLAGKIRATLDEG